MARFLTTRQISAELEQIIRDAKQHLVLISPYIKAHPTIKERLERKRGDDLDISLVCREKDLHEDERKWLQSMPFIKVSTRDNLHAKCYANEQVALITSMNLYGYSEINNIEMGILVSAQADKELYSQIIDEAIAVIENSKETAKPSQPEAKAQSRDPWARRRVQGRDRTSTTRVDPNPTPSSPARNKPSATVAIPEQGFCIRCGTTIQANPSKPYCPRCYATWERFADPDYQDERCHICGQENPATLNKPLCRTCYRQYRGVFQLA